MASVEREDSAAVALSDWAQRARSWVLAGSIVVGMASGFLFVDEWVLVYVLTYVSFGVLTGYVLYRAIALPWLAHRLRTRARRLAVEHDLDAVAIEAVARTFLV